MARQETLIWEERNCLFGALDALSKSTANEPSYLTPLEYLSKIVVKSKDIPVLASDVDVDAAVAIATFSFIFAPPS